MNGTKMSKNFFFQMIEKRLEELTEEVEKLKDCESFEMRLSKENIIFGRLTELYAINAEARDIDYWKYSELDRKIYEIREKI